MLRRWFLLLVLATIGATAACSLFAPTDEELFGNQGAGGTSRFSTVSHAGGTGPR